MRSGFEVPGGGKVCKYWSTDLWNSKPPIGQITSRTLRTINYCYSYLIYCTTKTGNPPTIDFNIYEHPSMFRSYSKLTLFDIHYSPPSYTVVQVNLYQPNAFSRFFFVLFYRISSTGLSCCPPVLLFFPPFHISNHETNPEITPSPQFPFSSIFIYSSLPCSNQLTTKRNTTTLDCLPNLLHSRNLLTSRNLL